MWGENFKPMVLVVCLLFAMATNLMAAPTASSSTSVTFYTVLEVSVSIPDTKASPGDVVEIPINVDNAEGIAGFQFTVTFDSNVLETQGVEAGDLNSDWTLMPNTNTSGQIQIAGFSPSLAPLLSGGGSLVKIKFKVVGNIGDSTTLDFSKCKLTNEESDEISSGTTNGTFIVNVNGIPISVAPGSVTIAPEGTASVTVSGGIAPYTVSSNDETVVTATVSDGTVTLTGVAAGTCTVTVSDSSSPVQTASIAVTVTPVVGSQPVPTGQNVTELTGADRANAPANLGSVVTGGDQMELALNFPAYEAAVDEYLAVQLPDCTLYFVAPDNRLTTEFVAYAVGRTDATNVTVCGSFAVCTPFGPSVPAGQWTVYSLVVPTNGGNFTTINWATDNYDLPYYTFEVTCP